MLINSIDLCNKHIRYIGRACNLCWIGFGEDIICTDIKNKSRSVAEYAIHIQCAFRIKHNKKIMISDNDMYYPSPDYQCDNEFYWDVQGANMFDYKTKEINMIFESDNIVVKNINLTENYDLSIELSDEYIIEIFNNSQDDMEFGEAWRFFKHSCDTSHLVVGRYGIMV